MQRHCHTFVSCLGACVWSLQKFVSQYSACKILQSTSSWGSGQLVWKPNSLPELPMGTEHLTLIFAHWSHCLVPFFDGTSTDLFSAHLALLTLDCEKTGIPTAMLTLVSESVLRSRWAVVLPPLCSFLAVRVVLPHACIFFVLISVLVLRDLQHHEQSARVSPTESFSFCSTGLCLLVPTQDPGVQCDLHVYMFMCMSMCTSESCLHPASF